MFYYVAKYGRVGDAVVAVAPAILIPISTSAYVSSAIASKLTPRKRVRLPFTEEQMKRAMENQDREVLKHIKDPELALRDTTIRLLYEIWKASREFWKYAKNIRIPLLLVHGEKDDIIPVEASRKAYNAVEL
ncbi:MAG: alpha/beta hydrolase [Ignisphaera sp.]|nr:alpha/beta hydrolase [Ignisphaera sp.]